VLEREREGGNALATFGGLFGEKRRIRKQSSKSGEEKGSFLGKLACPGKCGGLLTSFLIFLLRSQRKRDRAIVVVK
jgi:hypothetical protein